MAKLTGNNRHNIQWGYAQACWQALKNGDTIPPIPLYDEWESEETGGKGRVFTGKKPIDPMKVTCNGVTVYE
jgi:hypothetical protein